MCENIAKQPNGTKNGTSNAVHVHRHVGLHTQLQLALQPDAVPILSTGPITDLSVRHLCEISSSIAMTGNTVKNQWLLATFQIHWAIPRAYEHPGPVSSLYLIATNLSTHNKWSLTYAWGRKLKITYLGVIRYLPWTCKLNINSPPWLLSNQYHRLLWNMLHTVEIVYITYNSKKPHKLVFVLDIAGFRGFWLPLLTKWIQGNLITH